MKTHKILAATLAVGLLLVPASAMAGPGPNDHGNRQNVTKPVKDKGALKEAQKIFKETVKQAHQTKKAAYKAAMKQYLTDTVEDRAELKTALENATTDEERQSAKDTYRQNTLEERQTMVAAKKAANKTFKETVKAAKETYQAAKEALKPVKDTL